MSEFRYGYCPGVIGKNVRYRWGQIIGTFMARKGIQKMYSAPFTAICLNYPKLIKLETHHTIEVSEMNLKECSQVLFTSRMNDVVSVRNIFRTT